MIAKAYEVMSWLFSVVFLAAAWLVVFDVIHPDLKVVAFLALLALGLIWHDRALKAGSHE